MRFHRLFSLLSISILMFGCTEVSPIISEEELVVVWAYLYADQPVEDIHLTLTLPLDTDSTTALPINDAQVVLIKDNQRYECELTSGDSGYYRYVGDDFSVTAGDLIEIEMAYKDELITSQTVVPEKPRSVSVNESVMTIPDFNDRESMMAWREEGGNTIEVTWDNPDNSWYYVTLKNIDSNPVSIDSWRNDRMKDFVFPPMNDNKYSIRLPFITHLGLHRITVYKVNQEYVDLYESREQDSRDLNEPLTNIDNGLGVFSAFNEASVTLNVILQ